MHDSTIVVLGKLLFNNHVDSTEFYNEIAEKHLDTSELQTRIEMLDDAGVISYNKRITGKVKITLDDRNN